MLPKEDREVDIEEPNVLATTGSCRHVEQLKQENGVSVETGRLHCCECEEKSELFMCLTCGMVCCFGLDNGGPGI
jgi:uncharacterized UBP type Zn finger protein